MNQVLRSLALPSGAQMELVQGDITREPVEAIVNPANAFLQHGGGLAGLLASQGGPQVQAESDAWVEEHGPVRHHQPAYTSAGRLPFRYILHAVGPVWGDGGEDEKLRAAVLGSLALAERLQLSSLALPAISTGIFGFPKERAGRVILPAVHGYLGENPAGSLRRVRITLFDAPTLEAFTRAWDQSFPPAP